MSTAAEGTPYASDEADPSDERAAQLRVIEEEIRRQVVSERAANLTAAQQQPWIVELPDTRTPSHSGAAPAGNQAAPRKPSTLHRWKEKGGALGAIASFLLVIAKFAGPILTIAFKSKILITFGTALLSIVLEAAAFGWPMAIGMVSVILIHECGHAFATWQRGLPVKGIYIIPFMGGLAVRGAGGSPAEIAYIGIMGPVFGTAAGLVCWALYPLTGQPFFLALAYLVFYMHLFNMAPIYPLDGSKVLPLFSPKLLLVGLVFLFVLVPRNPMIWLLALMSLPYVISHWKTKPADTPTHTIKASDRWKYGLLYAGLTAFFALSSHYLHTVAFRPHARYVTSTSTTTATTPVERRTPSTQ